MDVAHIIIYTLLMFLLIILLILIIKIYSNYEINDGLVFNNGLELKRSLVHAPLPPNWYYWAHKQVP